MESSHREGLLDLFFLAILTFLDCLAILGFFLLTAAVAAVAVSEAAFFCTFGCSCEEKYVLAGRNRSVDTHLMFDWFL